MKSTPSTSHSHSDIKTLAIAFAEASNKPIAKPVTPQLQLLIESKAAIVNAIKNQWTYRAIAQWFTNKGLKVDERTVATFCTETLGIKKARRTKKKTILKA